MITAVVYTSNAGHTKEYAELIGQQLNLPVYDLTEAKNKFEKSTEIIYLGWLMAGKLKGIKTAKQHFRIKAVCAVGMSKGDGQLPDIRKSIQMSESVPVFYLQGGFEMEKLTGIYRLMMKTVNGMVGKGLSEKQDRTQDENELLDMIKNGKNMVSHDRLKGLFEWHAKQ